MTQLILTVEVDEFHTEESGAFQLHFQNQYKTEISEVKKSPKFSTHHFEILVSPESDGSVFLHIMVEDHQSGTPESKERNSIQLGPSTVIAQKEINFSTKIHGHLLLKYKTAPVVSSQIVRSVQDKEYLLNVTTGYLNTLYENPFTLRVTVLTKDAHVLSTFQLTNVNFHGLAKVTKDYGHDGVQVKIQDTADSSHAFSTFVTTQAPSIVYITLVSGDILTLTFKYTEINYNQLVGMVHSSVMREGSISTGDDDKPRLTLTPRRKSTMVSPRDSLRSSKIPGTLKKVLLLENDTDASHPPASTEEILSRMGAQSSSGGTRANPMAESSFLFSTSRSEILEIEDAKEKRKTKHLKRREMQNIALGILKLSKDFLNNPIKLKGTLLDVTFPDDGNGSMTQRHPSPEICYLGELHEVSREIFTESGLITCALEGKLHIQNSQLMGDVLDIHPGHQITEKIMVFKVIISLLSYHADDLPNATIPPTLQSSSVNEFEESKEFSVSTPIMDKLLQKSINEQEEKIQQHIDEKRKSLPQNELQPVVEENENEDRRNSNQELAGESEMNIPLVKQKITPLPSDPASKKSSQHNSKESLHGQSELVNPADAEAEPEVIPEGEEKQLEQKSNQSSKKSLSLQPVTSNKSLQPVASNKSIKSNQSQQQFGNVPILIDEHGEEVEPDNPPAEQQQQQQQQQRQHQSKGSLHENSSVSSLNDFISFKEDNKTGEIQGFSEAIRFGENLTVEDIINRRFPKKPNTRDFEENKRNIAIFAEILKEELLEKQKLIDELVRENHRKYEGIQLVGNDIKKLRDENIILKRKVGTLETEVKENKRKDLATADRIKDYLNRPDHKPIDTLDSKILANAVYHFHHELQQSKQTIATKEQEIMNLQQEKDKILSEKSIQSQQKLNLEKDFLKLKNYIINKQKEIEKLNYYQLTITTQEKIIAKLQLLLESKMKGKFSFLKSDQQQQQPQPSPQSHQHHSHHGHGHGHHHYQKDLQELQQLKDNLMKPPSSHENEKNPVPPAPQELLLEDTPSNNNNNNENEKLVQELNEKSKQLDSSNQEIVKLNNKIEGLEDQIRDLEFKLKNSRPKSASDEEEFTEIDINEVLKKNEFGQRPSSIANLKKANLTVDKLTAENLSKDFKIEALERQLEYSSRESAREIAKLRTKLFELEVGLAMTSHETGSNADSASNLLDEQFLHDIDLPEAPKFLKDVLEKLDHAEEEQKGERLKSKGNSNVNSTSSLKNFNPYDKSDSMEKTPSGHYVNENPFSRTRNTILEDITDVAEHHNDSFHVPIETGKRKTLIHSNTYQQPTTASFLHPEENPLAHIPSVKLLRQESSVDIDRIPTPNQLHLVPDSPGNQNDDLDAVPVRNENDLLSEILSDIEKPSRPSLTKVNTSQNNPGDHEMMQEILNEIN